MEGYGSWCSVQDSSKIQDLPPFGANPTGNAVFDASQYEFFGGDVVEEVELGGLDDLPPAGLEEEEFQLDKDEEDATGSLSHIDDLSSTFLKLNKIVSGPSSVQVDIGRGSRESSSAAELMQDSEFISSLDPRVYDAETIHENRKWSSQQYSSAHIMEPKSLFRASSYPEQQLQHPPQQNLHHQHSCEPILMSKPSFTSYSAPAGGPHQGSPNGHTTHPHAYHPSATLPPFSNPQLEFNMLQRGSQFGGNTPQLPRGLPINNQLQNQWMSQSGLHSGFPNNFAPQRMSEQNGLIPPQMLPPSHSNQMRMKLPFQPTFGHLVALQSQLLNPQLSALSPRVNNFDMLVSRDQRPISLPGSRQGMHYSHQVPDFGNQRGDSGRHRFRSKYMTADEIENILRIQHAATHSSDQYVDDFYYQACQSRKSDGAKTKHHFCPTNLRDGSSKSRTSNESHAFLQVDALGRVSFSSIRRPRPLLEIDSSNCSDHAESRHSEKLLEQEPMLAARVTIEDGMCLLLDVDDIDRVLQFNHLQDGGARLQQRRHLLLEGLASSLQLVDPLVKNGHTVNLNPNNDLVFLRLVSLPKGRKLLSKYLQLLPSGELARVVCMAIFRNLRFLFGNLPADRGAGAATIDLADTVCMRVHGMELKALAACLASVVCASEHPPLRPIGSPAGDAASLILKSVLERATQLFTDSQAASICSAPHRAFWQASFDAFFGLLTQYCFDKYDSVVQSFLTQAVPDVTDRAADVSVAISREMPIELLQASLPHTNEQQKNILLEFSQRSIPVLGFVERSD